MLASIATAVILIRCYAGGHSTTSLGNVAISSPVYVDSAIYERAFRVNRLIKMISWIPGVSRAWAVMHCARECLKIDECHSFVLETHGDICYLTNFSRCAEPSFVLYRIEGVQTYDVRRGRNAADETCFDACGSCDRCGRRNCRGPLCDDCPHACWDESMASRNGSFSLWPRSDPSILRKSKCDGGWQRIWGRSSDGDVVEFQVYARLWETPVVLRLSITYADDDAAHSLFASFEYSEGAISVGEYLQGDAGNFWEAPFTHRGLVSTKDCRAFFYAGGTCSAPPGNKPKYYWLVNDTERDSKDIRKIELWIKP